MTREEANNIARGITDKIEATTDIDDWAEFWGFTRDDYEEFLDMAIKALSVEPCEDCISRQVAINKMQDMEDEDIKAYGCSIPEGFDGKRAIEALMSIQPKPIEGDAISRKAVLEIAKSSKSNWIDNSVLFKRVNELPPVIPKPKTGWIPVSERYPKIEDECKYFLVTDDKGTVSVQKFLLSLEEEPQPYFSGMVNVIAWMPLPEPYTAESEEI